MEHRQDDDDVVVVDDDKTDSSAVYNTEWSKEATPLSFVVRAHSVNDDEEEKLWTVLLFQNWRLSMIYCQQVIIWGVLTYSEFCLNTIHSLPNGKVKGVGRFSHLALKEKKRYACFVYLFLYFRRGGGWVLYCSPVAHMDHCIIMTRWWCRRRRSYRRVEIVWSIESDSKLTAFPQTGRIWSRSSLFYI